MKRFYLFIFWTIVILALCGMPGNMVPKISWLEMLSYDKFVHAGIFFIEQLLLMRALQSYKKKYSGVAALSFCVFYGSFLELMQYYVFSQRTCDVLDIIANSIGTMLGFLLFSKINKKLGFLPA